MPLSKITWRFKLKTEETISIEQLRKQMKGFKKLYMYMGILCICLYYIILDQLHNFKLQILFFLNNHLPEFDEQTLKISNKISPNILIFQSVLKRGSRYCLQFKYLFTRPCSYTQYIYYFQPIICLSLENTITSLFIYLCRDQVILSLSFWYLFTFCFFDVGYI